MGRSLMFKSRLVLGLMLVSAVSPGAVLAASSQATAELEGVGVPFDINAALQGDVYLLGPGDVLELKLFDAPELSGTLEVLNDGSVALPLVGSVGVAASPCSRPATESNGC